MQIHGVVMQEYVAVPDSLLAKTAEVKKFFGLSYAYVGSLKTKQTKAKPAKKKST